MRYHHGPVLHIDRDAQYLFALSEEGEEVYIDLDDVPDLDLARIREGAQVRWTTQQEAPEESTIGSSSVDVPEHPEATRRIVSLRLA
jgi:hypothetical protein